MELTVPLTGLDKYEELVGLPDFSAGAFTRDDYISNATSHFQEHFASQIVLRRLSVEFHSTLSKGRLPFFLIPRFLKRVQLRFGHKISPTLFSP